MRDAARFPGGVAVALVCALAVCQGGFYASATCALGLIASAAYAGWAALRRFQSRSVQPSADRKDGESFRLPGAMVLLLAIACLQLISAIAHGASATMLLEAATWFAVAGMSLWCAFRSPDDKRWCLGVFGVAGAAIAAVGVVLYCGAVPFEGAVSAGRLMFPFQYANASGVFFGVAAVACVSCLPRAWKAACVLPIAALLLTRSIGAIAISAVALVAATVCALRRAQLPKTYGIALATVVVLTVALAAAFAQGRIAEASQTFVERVIQMLDASARLAGSPVLGIGPDQWQLMCPLVQTAQYRAAVVHNSYLQVALDAGVVAALLLVVLFARGIVRCIRIGDFAGALCAGVIAAHALVDFDFQFSALMLLAVLCMADGGETPRAGRALRALSGIALAACLAISGVGTWLSALEADLADAYARADGMRAASLVSSHATLQSDGVLAAYAAGALFVSGDYQTVIDVTAWQATDGVAESALMYRIYSLRALGQANDSRELLVDSLHARPYDVELYKILREYVDQSSDGDGELAQSFNVEAVRANELAQKGHAAWLSNQELIETV